MHCTYIDDWGLIRAPFWGSKYTVLKMKCLGTLFYRNGCFITLVSCDEWRLHWSGAEGLEIRISCLGFVDSERPLKLALLAATETGNLLLELLFIRHCREQDFWVVTPCWLVNSYQRLCTLCSCHLEVQAIFITLLRNMGNSLRHDVTSQQTSIFMKIADNVKRGMKNAMFCKRNCTEILNVLFDYDCLVFIPLWPFLQYV